MLQQATMNMIQTWKKFKSFSKEIEDIKKNQIENLEQKNTITE